MKIITKKGIIATTSIHEFRCIFCKCAGVIDEEEYRKLRSSRTDKFGGILCPCCGQMIFEKDMSTNLLFEECAIPEDWDYIPGKTEVPNE